MTLIYSSPQSRELAMNVTTKTLYDTDFSRWIEEQAQLLRDRQLNHLDIENLIEEIESLGKSDKRQLKSRLEVLFHHLLKWQYQPTQRTGSWQGTILEQRRRIRDVLLDSPSLKSYIETVLNTCYADARYQASLETGLSSDCFPLDCPYAIANILNPEFWPEN
jgi:Domain of unknown function DUF29